MTKLRVNLWRLSVKRVQSESFAFMLPEHSFIGSYWCFLTSYKFSFGSDVAADHIPPISKDLILFHQRVSLFLLFFNMILEGLNLLSQGWVGTDEIPDHGNRLDDFFGGFKCAIGRWGGISFFEYFFIGLFQMSLLDISSFLGYFTFLFLICLAIHDSQASRFRRLRRFLFLDDEIRFGFTERIISFFASRALIVF